MNAFKEDSGDTVLSHHTINLLGLAVGVRVRPRLMLMLMLCTSSMLTESAKTHTCFGKNQNPIGYILKSTGNQRQFMFFLMEYYTISSCSIISSLMLTGVRAGQPVPYMRLTNSKPQPSSPWRKSSPALHLFLFEKLFHSDILHSREEKTIATYVSFWLFQFLTKNYCCLFQIAIQWIGYMHYAFACICTPWYFYRP